MTHAIEQLIDALTGELGQCLPYGLADHLASNQFDIPLVGELVDVIRPAQDRDGHRRVRQQAGHALRVAALDGARPRLEQLRVDPREQIPC